MKMYRWTVTGMREVLKGEIRPATGFFKAHEVASASGTPVPPTLERVTRMLREEREYTAHLEERLRKAEADALGPLEAVSGRAGGPPTEEG